MTPESEKALAEKWALSKSEPLRALIINGKSYPIGELSAAQLAAAMRLGERRLAGSTDPLDNNPETALIVLLDTANPGMNFGEMKGHVTPKHIALADKELERQMVVAVFNRHEGSA